MAVSPVSGGEPLLQWEFVTELFTLAKEKKVHTALDTAGSIFGSARLPMEKFERLMEVTDLVLLDLKEMNPREAQRTYWHGKCTHTGDGRMGSPIVEKKCGSAMWSCQG